MNREYDFTNDTAFGPFYTDEKSIWKRYFLYKNRVGAHDPDSMSYKLQQIYRKLWGDDWPDYMMTGKNTYEKSDGIYESIYKRNPMESNKKIPSIYGETLNTPTTALNGLLASAGLNSVKQQTIFYLCTGCEDEEFEKKLKAPEKDPSVRGTEPTLVDSVIDYLKAWHLLGNFMPVPAGFNCGRYQATLDFFDLTLKYIYDWYCYGNESNALDTLISEKTPTEKEMAVKNTRKWLSSFKEDGKPSWQIFVKKNYLSAFVEKQEDGKYGIPKEFWAGHFSGQIMPENIDEYRRFFINATQCIRGRNTVMYDALESKSVGSVRTLRMSGSVRREQ